MSTAEAATRFFDEGHACSQAVLLAFTPDTGLAAEDATRLASGFGGGMRLGGACGAVTGAVMVLGLALCEDDCASGRGREAVGVAAREFGERFVEQMGSLDCPGILECDIRTEEGAARAKELDLYATACTKAVRVAATILDDLLGSELA